MFACFQRWMTEIGLIIEAEGLWKPVPWKKFQVFGGLFFSLLDNTKVNLAFFGHTVEYIFTACAYVHLLYIITLCLLTCFNV